MHSIHYKHCNRKTLQSHYIHLRYNVVSNELGQLANWGVHDTMTNNSQSSLETEDKSEELLIRDLDPAIAVCVICFEGVCQCLGDSGEKSSYQLQPVSTNTCIQTVFTH